MQPTKRSIDIKDETRIIRLLSLLSATHILLVCTDLRAVAAGRGAEGGAGGLGGSECSVLRDEGVGVQPVASVALLGGDGRPPPHHHLLQQPLIENSGRKDFKYLVRFGINDCRFY